MLTERQMEILKAIHQYIQANSISPTVRNIVDLVGLKSSSTVYRHLSNLEKEGYITKIDTSLRSITITEVGLKLINTKE
ncbi:winged helix-turn-helix transcriptional regulator [Alkaliphilus sp. MSJ-5]|uniref:Winged helix-turn-helix transcriptional regulator n=1 Tax=Alkaliphilus flagellatus TaxID=2841507 RepID=A0ABS6G5M9_9FIRM|nr:winged helix-turn-helix transcriptional regulator [Alkaliphilus flagellatus]MBU5677798.1 winged helix-turn-helix transcriptional regulator [Alkaliphilus flagellatus]